MALLLASASGPALAQTCLPNQISDSIYFNKTNTTFDPQLQEAMQDAGGMMHTGVLADLLNGFSLTSWQNPVPYTSIDTSDFAWDHPLQAGSMNYREYTIPKTINYDYRRYTMLGDSGVIFFPDGFLDSPPQCLGEPHRVVDIFIGCRSTDGQLHAIPHRPDQKPVDGVGPSLTPMGLLSLKRSKDYIDGTSPNHVIFALPAGGSGPHPAWQMIQSVLAIRKRLHEMASEFEFCYQVGDVYLQGGSFGTAVALHMLQVYPVFFDGACVQGAHGLATQSFFGYQRYLKFGMQMTHLPIFNGANSDILLPDDFYYHEAQALVAQAPPLISPPPITPSGGLDNLSFLSRSEWWAAQPTPILPGRPIILLASDEDNVLMSHLFRYELEDLGNVMLNTNMYKEYYKVLPVAFHEHTDNQGEGTTITLHPGDFFQSLSPPSTGNLIDWLVQMKTAMVAAGDFGSGGNINIDEGVPEPKAITDYRLHEATIDSPRDAPNKYGGFDLINLWEENGGKGFVGTGVEPGLQHNLIVEDLDGDEVLEVVFGDADGLRCRDRGSATERRIDLLGPWRSRTTHKHVRTFSDTGSAKGLIVATHSGELWTIKLAGGFAAYEVYSSHFKYGGERENPSVEIGPLEGGVTPVYIVGTGTCNSPGANLPNECRITRLNFSQLDASASPGPTVAYQERCEPVTDLVWDDAEDELIATNMRGYLMRIRDLGSPNFFQLAPITNFGLGEYIDLAACQARKVVAGSEKIYFVAGIAGDPNVVGSNPEFDRNIVALDACGEIRGGGSAKALLTGDIDTNNYFMGINAFCVVGQNSSTIRLAIASAGDGIQFWDYSIGSSTFAKVTTAPIWSPQVYFDNSSSQILPSASTILSLEFVELDSQTGRLFGTTDRGIVFAFDLPPGFSTPSTLPVVMGFLEPFWGAYGLKVIDRALDEDPYTCGDDELSLNVLPHFSCYPPFAGTEPDKLLAGSAYYKLDALTGEILCRRERKRFGRAFNPERRDPGTTLDGLTWDVFWDDQVDPDQNKHIFEETIDLGHLESTSQFDLAYTPTDLSPGQLLTTLDYLASTPQTLAEPSSGLFMKTDRFYTTKSGSLVTYYGNAVRIGNIYENGDGVEEIVLTTSGGRLVTARMFNGALVYETSWDDGEPSKSDGDYGSKLTGLSLYDIDGDGYDEIFAVCASYSRPTALGDNNSRLLIWDPNPSTLVLGDPDQEIDLGEPGCMGLWIGPGLGRCPCSPTTDIIIGKSQTFEIHKIVGSTLPISLSKKYESEGLGSHLGAFNSIEVLQGIDDGQEAGKVVDYIYMGSNAYVYGFRTKRYADHLGGQ